MNKLKIFCFGLSVLFFMLFNTGPVRGQVCDTSPLFKETKVKNYLPHMTWCEVEDALKRTDMVIVPVGAIEQHGKHLPLGTDIYYAVEVAKMIAQETDVLVAPVILAGLSAHHKEFPGTLSLSPKTYEAVLYETALCLINQGFKKIMIYNGHGGNTVSISHVVERINHNTPAIAVFLNDIKMPEIQIPELEGLKYDWHAGVAETSEMLYLTHGLVDMEKAENPTMNIPEICKDISKRIKDNRDLALLESPHLFRPKETGKSSSSREVSSNGAMTSGDIREASAEIGNKLTKNIVNAAVKFINAWKELKKN